MKYEEITRCRACFSPSLSNILNLGDQPPANSLHKPDDPCPSKIPLTLLFCENCNLVQLRETVDPIHLFQKYLWVTATSKTARQYGKLFSERVLQRIEGNKPRVLEVASNDGTFLKSFIDRGCEVLGVDPAENISEIATKNGVRNIPAFFGSQVAREILSSEGDFDVLIARNVIPHVKDIHSVIEGIKTLLHNDSIGVIEFHDSRLIQEQIQYDYIYHEHLFYFSLNSIIKLLGTHDLVAFDLERSPISGGSWVIYFSKGKKTQTDMLKKATADEDKAGLTSLSSWLSFSEKTVLHRKKLRELIVSDEHSCLAYGASARSSTLLNFCNIDSQYIFSIIDRNPLKTGLVTPGSGIPIVGYEESVEKIKHERRILLLAWNFEDEIVDDLRSKGFGGKLIVPLPGYPRVI